MNYIYNVTASNSDICITIKNYYDRINTAKGVEKNYYK